MGLSINIVANGANQSGEYNNPGQILDNAVTAANTAAAQTLLTIPAGRTWVGSIALAASNTTAGGSSATATVATAGSGVTPTAGTTILRVHCSTVGTVAGLASQNNEVGDIIVAASSAGAVTLTLTNSTATTFTSDASAVGVLL